MESKTKIRFFFEKSEPSRWEVPKYKSGLADKIDCTLSGLKFGLIYKEGRFSIGFHIPLYN
jgi:hypothetical protein